MTFKHLNKVLSATLVFMCASSIALADPTNAASGADSNKHHGKSAAEWQAKRAEMRQKFAQELGLTAEQQTRIDALRSNFKESHKAQFEAKRAQMKELHELKKSGASQEQIDAKKAAIQQQFAGLKADREKLAQQTKAVLTPEQAKKWDDMKAQHHQKCGKRGEKHGEKHEKPAAK